MSRVWKITLVAVLALSMMLAGPASALARPDVPNVDPPMAFSSEDLTAQINSVLQTPITEVTAICSPIGDLTLIAGIDSAGKIALVAWDGTHFDDWTDLFKQNVGTDWTRINAIVYANQDYTVGGAVIDNETSKAGLVTICGACYRFGEGHHEHIYRDSTLTSHAAVTDLSYDADNNDMAITTSGSDALFVMADAHMNNGDPALVTDAAMAGTKAPIGLLGNSYSTKTGGMLEAETADLAAQTNAVKQLNDFAPYWAFGTGAGNVLAYGCDVGNSILGQTMTTVGGATDIMALDYDWNSNAWMIGARGADGTLNLFRDTHEPALSATFYLPTTTELPFPATITANADGELAGCYFMVGGTGSEGHLYKYNSVYSEMIDLDYLVAGMTKVNAVKQDNAEFQFNGLNGFGTSYALVGGAGSKTLIRVTQSPAYSNPVTGGAGTTTACPAGGASVTFPAGAVATDYGVIIEKVAAGTPAVPGGLSLLGTSYEFKCFDTSGTPITTFSQPVTITISYDPAALNGMSEDSLVIYYYDTTDSTWKAVTPCTVDKVNHTVTITANHFTQFGILGATATTMPFTGN